jgi:hydrogenase maturation protein HypF
MKNTVALAWKNRVIISPHIGEMDSVRSLDVFENTVNDLQNLYGVKAERIICDAHPGYTTTRWANKQKLAVHPVFHHHAHASAAYYECHTDESVLVFSWDGVGYGEDGTLWGGETFMGKPGQWQRLASMRAFNLPGGDKAGRQPWRSAAALCWQAGLTYDDIPEKGLSLYPMLKQAWQQKNNAPQSSSVGRLFDAAAALTGVCSEASFEGQGPMMFEALCGGAEEEFNDWIEFEYETEVDSGLLITNWQPVIETMLDSALSITTRALLFHHSLAHCIWQQAKMLREKHGVNTVSFSGGVFQNRVLTEKAMALLSDDGFEVCLPGLIPVNDAGISFGQVMEYGFKVVNS